MAGFLADQCYPEAARKAETMGDFNIAQHDFDKDSGIVDAQIYRHEGKNFLELGYDSDNAVYLSFEDAVAVARAMKVRGLDLT